MIGQISMSCYDFKGINRLKVKKLKKDLSFSSCYTKSDKTDIMTKVSIGAKERHFIMIKGSIHQEDIIIITYALNDGAPK